MRSALEESAASLEKLADAIETDQRRYRDAKEAGSAGRR
jgi:hypothetical protein